MNSSRTPFTGLGIFMGAMTVAWSSNAFVFSAPLAVAGIVAGILIVLGAVLLRMTRRAAGTGPEERTAEAHEAHLPTPDRSKVPARPPTPGRRTALVPPRILGAAVLAEVVGIVAVSVLLGRSGHGDLVMPSIALVVAAHFALFLLTQPHIVHLVTTAIGCFGAGTAILLVGNGVIAADAARALAGLSLASCCALYGALFCLLTRADAVAGRSTVADANADAETGTPAASQG